MNAVSSSYYKPEVREFFTYITNKEYGDIAVSVGIAKYIADILVPSPNGESTYVKNHMVKVAKIVDYINDIAPIRTGVVRDLVRIFYVFRCNVAFPSSMTYIPKGKSIEDTYGLGTGLDEETKQAIADHYDVVVKTYTLLKNTGLFDENKEAV